MNDDLIRRKDMMKWFCTNYCSEHNACEDDIREGSCYAMDEMQNLPSAGNVHRNPEDSYRSSFE